MEKPKQGIFENLDDSCQVKSDDLQLLNNMKKNHAANPFFSSPKINNAIFIIIHTAKDVEYNITGFREKNLDELSNLLF
jgi:myosin heavy subunit